jgi:hypothetical protein
MHKPVERRTGGALVWICLLVGASVPALGQEQHRSGSMPSKTDYSLREALQSYLRSPLGDDKTTRYSVGYVDLNGDGEPEAIVYVTGETWCGSGGCPTLILARVGTSYRVITRIYITRPPIRVLNVRSHGWRIISVLVAGGGIQTAYEAELSFNGKSYPINPSTVATKRSPGQLEGRVVIGSAEDGKLLYP